MGVFEHSRFRIFNSSQHPFVHDPSQFAYSNPRLPDITLLSDAIDYLINVVYPNYKGTVADVASLPLIGTVTANDYYIVDDDGDGKSAGYVAANIEGTLQWYKRYDVDWTYEGILGAAVDRTSYLYVHKMGMTDKDSSGADIVGTYAGQTIYGGNASGQNLTFNANSAATNGFVQTDNTFRPTSSGTLDLGTAALKWNNLYAVTGLLGTLTATSGSITDSSGAISFDNENLSTTGTLASGSHTVSSDLVLASGSITSVSGAISFGDENLTTSGYVHALYLQSSGSSLLANITIDTSSITSATDIISFGAAALSTTGTLNAGNTTVSRLDVDNVRIDSDTISSTLVGGTLTFTASGGIIFSNTITSADISATGTVGVTGQLNADNLRLDGNTLSATNANGSITISPLGTGTINVGSSVLPGTSASYALGDSTHLFTKLWLSSAIGDATNEITIATLLSLRDINTGVASGMSLFYDGSKWVASAPDTEIDHGTISGLLDDDHTQYMLLAGRAGGQDLIGGTAASNNLTINSTSHATKGSILVKSNFKPFTNASYSGGWSGTDIGGSSNYFNNIYSKGVHKGLRLENYTSVTLPSASAQNTGRVVWSTDDNRLYTDTGGSWTALGAQKFSSDTSWNGSDTTKDVTVSSSVSDARTCLWQLCDNANDYERIYTSIKAISSSVVRITVNVALPAGSYRLIGIQ